MSMLAHTFLQRRDCAMCEGAAGIVANEWRHTLTVGPRSAPAENTDRPRVPCADGTQLHVAAIQHSAQLSLGCHEPGFQLPNSSGQDGRRAACDNTRCRGPQRRRVPPSAPHDAAQRARLLTCGAALPSHCFQLAEHALPGFSPSASCFEALQAPCTSLVTVPLLADPKDRGKAIEEEAVSDEYNRVITSENTMTSEEEAVCQQLVQALDLRWKWLFRPKDLPEHDTVRSLSCLLSRLCLRFARPPRFKPV